MEIIGFILSLLLLLYVTASVLFITAFTLPYYTIGGAVNKKRHKVLMLLICCGVGYLWYLLFQYSPFTISIS